MEESCSRNMRSTEQREEAKKVRQKTAKKRSQEGEGEEQDEVRLKGSETERRRTGLTGEKLAASC